MTPRARVSRSSRESRGSRRRQQPRIVLLRQVPGDSSVHRLWAGTKLLCVAALGLTVSLVPSWPSVGLGVAVLLSAWVGGRLPMSVLPRLPLWFWLSLLAGGALTLLSGGRPEVAVGGAHVGLGNLELYARFVALSAVLLGCSAIVGWTTPLGDIAPAVARLGAPLRRVRVPVDEWAVTVALCVRSLPLLAGEMRTLAAARRLRPHPRGHRAAGLHLLDEVVDALTAAMVVSMRRAGELGEAITARGGTRLAPGHPAGPGRADAVAFSVVAAACAGAFVVAAL